MVLQAQIPAHKREPGSIVGLHIFSFRLVSPKSRVLNSRKINQNRSRISSDYNDGQVVALFDLGSPRKPWKPRERVRRHSFSIPDWPSSRMRTLLRAHLVNHVRDLAAQIAHRAAAGGAVSAVGVRR